MGNRAKIRTYFDIDDIDENAERLRIEHHAVLLAQWTEPNASYRKLAAKLGWPVGTVKSRLNRARIQLAALIEKAKEEAA